MLMMTMTTVASLYAVIPRVGRRREVGFHQAFGIGRACTRRRGANRLAGAVACRIERYRPSLPRNALRCSWKENEWWRVYDPCHWVSIDGKSAPAVEIAKDEDQIRRLLEEANGLLGKGELESGLAAFDTLLSRRPFDPRVQFGRARAMELLSEDRKSNSLLESCIDEYTKVLSSPDVPEELARETGSRLVDRARFRGWLGKAVQAHLRLLELFPGDMASKNDLGVTYLLMGRNDRAKAVFSEVLAKEPEDGFALVHYGFILKTAEENLRDGAEYLRRGIGTRADGTQDGRFYFHLGDALQRLKRADEAYELYDEAAQRGVFPSKWQRSLYNAPGLTARPFWTIEQTTYADKLRAIRSEWRTIRAEGLALLDEKTGDFKAEDEKLTNAGEWKQFTLYARGRRTKGGCERAPKTCAILSKFPDAVGCTRSQVKFSVMTGGTRAWPHCGPTNCRLRAHLGLVVPPEPRIRVGNETRRWRAGEFLVFNDSFEHEVWHDDDDVRLILIVDFWHPELTAAQRTSLSLI